MLIDSTTLPTESFDEVVVYDRGQPVYLPTRKKVPGLWSCTINEIQYNIVMRILLGMETEQQFSPPPVGTTFIKSDFNPFDIQIRLNTIPKE